MLRMAGPMLFIGPGSASVAAFRELRCLDIQTRIMIDYGGGIAHVSSSEHFDDADTP